VLSVLPSTFSVEGLPEEEEAPKLLNKIAVIANNTPKIKLFFFMVYLF
jgi:hypothetical protein